MTDDTISPPHGSHSLRVEDAALITGAGRFSDDLKLDGQAAGVFVRSVHAHARITGIATEEARAFPGVLAVLTAADMAEAGVGNLSRPGPQTGRDGRALIVPHRPSLAGERVVHIGEAVALVVAETLAAARDAADLVVVDYQPLPALSAAEDALADGAPQIWSEAPGNLALHFGAPEPADESEAAVDGIIAEAARVVHIRAVNQRIAGMPLETRGATAVYAADKDHYTVHAPSQAAHIVKAQLMGIMGLKPEQLQVFSGDVGGAFGLKTAPYPENPALMVAAKKLGRPVHWMATRAEAFLSDNQARDQVSEATLALDADGRFLALKISAFVNLGAYVTAAGAGIATRNFANCFPEMYDIPHIAVDVRAAFTNTVPTGPYRGAGRPEANYVMERLVDAAARETGIDPVDLRRRNLVPPAAMPYRSAIGNTYDTGDFAAVLDAATDLANSAGFAERRAGAERRGKLRGLGVSCFLEHAGGPATEGAVLAIENGRLIVRLGVHPAGQGHATVYRDLAADRLGIPADEIVVEQGDSDLPIKGGPAVGSRSTSAAGVAVVAAVGTLIETASALMAEMFDADRSAVAWRDGHLEIAGTNHRLSLFELADRLAGAGKAEALTTVVQADTATTFPYGCHIAEVEIDPETGGVTLAGYVAVDDCGNVLAPTLAEGQVVGGIVQGIGQALLERIVYDADGQLVTGSLMDYCVPRADDLPFITSEFAPVASTANSLGVKGVGEAGSTAAIAAVMNAITDALPAGANIDMPATPEKVWRACAGAR